MNQDSFYLNNLILICLLTNISQLPIQQVWSHFDAGSCPGSAVGVRCRLDNGCSGFIHIKNLSDKKVIDPLDRVKVMKLACQI